MRTGSTMAWLLACLCFSAGVHAQDVGFPAESSEEVDEAESSPSAENPTTDASENDGPVTESPELPESPESPVGAPESRVVEAPIADAPPNIMPESVPGELAYAASGDDLGFSIARTLKVFAPMARTLFLRHGLCFMRGITSGLINQRLKVVA